MALPQTAVATFTGVESYVDITWGDTYTTFRLVTGITTTDGTSPGIRLCNPSDPTMPVTGAAVRVEPTAPFSGKVYVLNMEIA